MATEEDARQRANDERTKQHPIDRSQKPVADAGDQGQRHGMSDVGADETGDRGARRFGWTFCPGDKVMQVENDYDKDVYNGDLGVVSRIDMEEGELSVDFDGRDVNYRFGELDELVLAYATTIHKSQGSEYPAVVIPLTTQHYPMLQRNLVYTGVTRGKRLVVLVGQRKALAIAVKGSRARRRWSKLREWLIGDDGQSTKRAGSD